MTTIYTLKSHLSTCHKSDLCQLTTHWRWSKLQEYNLYACHQCDEYVCDSPRQLKTHLDKHVEKRTDTNFDIVTKHLYDDVDCVQKNHWREGLAFLRSTKFTEPLPSGQTLICLINFRLEFAVLSTFFQVIVCCVEAHNTAKDARCRAQESRGLWPNCYYMGASW